MNGLVNLFLKDFKAGFQIKYIHIVIVKISSEVGIYPNTQTFYWYRKINIPNYLYWLNKNVLVIRIILYIIMTH